MKRIKEPSVANAFYFGDAEKLRNQIDEFAASNTNKYDCKTRALIVPHAGLVYSGALAYSGISHLNKDVKNIFIFAPAHRVYFEGLALTSYDEWKTPLGNIEINNLINQELKEKFDANYFDEALAEEHSIEVQVPIIQSLFNNVKIIPVLIGQQDYKVITDIISEYYKNTDFGFIISSDLSHFLSDKEARRIDNTTAQMVETGNIQNFSHEMACGATGICALVEFANKFNYSLVRVGMINSSHLTGDKSRVVGYGSWILYEGDKNRFIKEYYSDYLLKLCKSSILSEFENNKIETQYPAVFDELGACFVTLKKHGNLRGCIGSIIAHRSLFNDLIQHSKNAAFNDPRFKPVVKDEVNDLKINISLLSNPKQIAFCDETDLLNKIIPYKDGIIIKDKGFQAVYLPSVWEELPDKEVFLKSLKMKAGMPADYFSPTFEAYRFETEYIEEK